MEISMEERCQMIIKDCMDSEETNPLRLFRKLASREYIRIHGPEHHILDGASILTVFYNAGGKIDLKEGLMKLTREGLKMPGAICGLWGICGSAASVGASLAIIEGTGPLSIDESYGMHMSYTSKVLERMAEIGGPRCCKRHGYIAINEAVEYLNERFSLRIQCEDISCEYSNRNEQCIKEKCPFYVGG